MYYTDRIAWSKTNGSWVISFFEWYYKQNQVWEMTLKQVREMRWCRSLHFDLYLCFSCLKRSKKSVQMCMRRSERSTQISIRMTSPSARRTCRSFSPARTLSSTVRPLCALMILWGTFFVSQLVCVRMCAHACACEFLRGLC